MTAARDIMTANPEIIESDATLTDAARKMRDLQVGFLPVCSTDGQLQGVVTDRDIVVKCIADGGDPSSSTVSHLAEGEPVTIGADDSVEEAMQTMSEYDVVRLPVIDGHSLVGVITRADLARTQSASAVGNLSEDIATSPANS